MANARIRLTQQTINSVSELGQQCGIEDADTVIKLLIRKYGDSLINLLAPSDPIRDSLTVSVPHSTVIESKPIQLESVQSNAVPQVTTNGSKPAPPPRTRITGLD